MPPPSDHSLRVGRVFARLQVVDYVMTRYTKRGDVRHFYLCLCECGNAPIVEWHQMRSGHTTTCGCAIGRASRRHGHAVGGKTSPTYNSWMGMFSRCDNPKDKRFANYGGRGITIHRRWRDSFENFLADMGERPPGTTLDRIDVHGHYEPGNCRWTTWKEQQRNRSNNTLVTIGGETKCVAEWLERLAMPRATYDNRLKAGMAAETALATPRRPYRKTQEAA